jgi:hypothetical protein
MLPLVVSTAVPIWYVVTVPGRGLKKPLPTVSSGEVMCAAATAADVTIVVVKPSITKKNPEGARENTIPDEKDWFEMTKVGLELDPPNSFLSF